MIKGSLGPSTPSKDSTKYGGQQFLILKLLHKSFAADQLNCHEMPSVTKGIFSKPFAMMLLLLSKNNHKRKTAGNW